MFTFAALIEYSAAAYLEKRKNFLQNKVQNKIVELGYADEMGKALAENVTTTLMIPTTEKAERRTSLCPDERLRKVSFVSKKMNDPKLIEVNLT